MHRIFSLYIAILLAAFASDALAENIAVGNYGSSANGMPFAVALEKGYFQQEGANVTGIIASEGGGTSVRNAMAGVAYGEANPGAIAVAIQQGADDAAVQRAGKGLLIWLRLPLRDDLVASWEAPDA